MWLRRAANIRIIANEISVQPVGSESELKDVTANLDDAIEKNYEAALIAWVNNTFGLKRRMVLTLTGCVKNANERTRPLNLPLEFPAHSKC